MPGEQPLLIDLGQPKRKPSKRREQDTYFTPDWATQALLKAYPELRGAILLDPCCGDGRMLRALAPRFAEAVGNDIAAANGSDWYGFDAAKDDLYRWAGADVIVTNPPFNLCGEIAWQCVRPDRPVRIVALLLRCTFLEPCAGREWLTRRPPTAILCLPRISFTQGDTDSAPCWWFLWGEVEPGIKVVTAKEQAELFAIEGGD